MVLKFKNKEAINEYQRKWRKNNKELVKKYSKKYRDKNKKNIKEYREKNKEAIVEYYKKYYQKNKEIKKKYLKKWRKENKKFINTYITKWQKEKRKNDVNFKLKTNLRRRMNEVLRRNKNKKRTIEFLDCSIDELWKYLESKFKPGMTKENYGLYGWHIDHKIPCAAFDFRCPVQQLACFHYSNLQPLWAKDNIKKGDKLNYEME